MKKTEPTTKIVQLNNKSRKGTYLYIKEQNKQGRYYKITQKTEEIPVTKYYKDKYAKKTKLKGTLKQYKRAYLTPTTLKKGKTWKQYKISKSLKGQAQKYLRQISKRPTISEAIKKGLTQITINNANKANAKTIQNAHKQLLQDLIIDRKLLDLITKPENTKKLANRYENKITIKNKEGQTIITATKYNTTPEQVIKEIKEHMPTGKEIDKTNPIKELQKLGYQAENAGFQTNQTIGNTDLTITFRKGE